MASVAAVSLTQNDLVLAKVYGEQARDITIPPEHQNNVLTMFQQKIGAIKRQSDGGELGKQIIAKLQVGLDGVNAQISEHKKSLNGNMNNGASSHANKDRGDGKNARTTA
jgi:hypothetical protein